MPGRRRRWPVFLLLVVAVLLAVGGLVMWQYDVAAPLLSSILSVLGTLLVTMLSDTIRGWLGGLFSRDRESSADQAERAARVLHDTVLLHWQQEANAGRLLEDFQIPVKYRVIEPSTARGVYGNVAPRVMELTGFLKRYADNPRRTIVTGEPGSGKTSLCILLALGVLNSSDQSRVPVLLRISSWDPIEENLYAWVARELTARYGFPADKRQYGSTIIAELYKQRRLLLILDGLDEMSDRARITAIGALEQDVLADEPLVLTCRSAELAALGKRVALPRMQMVESLPLAPSTIKLHLHDTGFATGFDRWQPVHRRVTDDPSGPLAKALNSPLMLSSARRGYQAPDTDPAELVDRAGTSRDVQGHLLDNLIATAFARRPAAPGQGPGHEPRRCTPEQAERYLTTIASLMSRWDTRDFAWWKLPLAVPRPVFCVMDTLIGAVICAGLGGLTLGLFGRPVAGLVLGFVIGSLAGLTLALTDPEPPRRLALRASRRPSLAMRTNDLTFAAVGGLSASLVTLLPFGRTVGMAMGAGYGVVFGLVRVVTRPDAPDELHVSPAGTLRSDRRMVIYAWALGGAIGTVAGALVATFGHAGRQDLVFLADNAPAATALGGGVGLILGAAGLGLTVQATSAWGRFLKARRWLALRGQLPLRLMRFLDDACDVGVMRRSGPYYRFSHALLQERLAERGRQRPLRPPPRTAERGRPAARR